MATGVKFEVLTEDLAEGVHQFQAAGHTCRIYLSNATPTASGDAVKADLAEITIENGYAGAIDVENDTSRTGGTTTVTAVAKIVTASGGTVGPFRYVAAYNDTPTAPADPLLEYWDYGSAITLNSGETFTWSPTGGALLTVA